MNNYNINLFDILQNPAIGVIAIHSFIEGYNSVAKHKEDRHNYPSLDYIFYILPIIYDSYAINNVKMELYTTLTANKNITLGFQERANKMSGQTLDSLNLGFSKKIFYLNKETFTIELEPDYSKNILSMMKIQSQFLSDVKKASKRLGNIFAKKDEKVLQLELNIRF